MRRSGRIRNHGPYAKQGVRVRSAAVALAALVAAGCGGGDPSAGRATLIEQKATDDQNLARAQAGETDGGAPGGPRPAGTPTETVTTAVAATTPAASPAPRSLLSAADRAGFARLARSLPGSEGLAVTTLRRSPLVVLGTLRTGVAWSTAKAPVAMAAIAAGTARQADLRSAITASDNAAAERLWAGLGTPAAAAAAATEQLRGAGDGTTSIESRRLRSGYTAFGQTSWRLTDQARFVAGMACTAAGTQVLELMGEVVPGQRWGLGDTGLDARFKGGWGPGTRPGAPGGWLERQMGIVTVDGRPLVVAMASTAPGHDAGIRALTRMARWVAGHADPAGAPAEPRC